MPSGFVEYCRHDMECLETTFKGNYVKLDQKGNPISAKMEERSAKKMWAKWKQLAKTYHVSMDYLMGEEEKEEEGEAENKKDR